MNSEILQLGNFLGCILQPLYFCLFMFYVKKIKTKRILFILLSTLDYIIIQNLIKFTNGINADLFYTIIFYINLKMFYKETNITSLITYIISNLLLGIINIISYFIFGMNIIGLTSVLVIPIIIVLILSKKLCILDHIYKKYWNRSRIKRKVKSITFRGASACVTILLFVILHFWNLYLLLK